jgi:hypothetical protein
MSEGALPYEQAVGAAVPSIILPVVLCSGNLNHSGRGRVRVKVSDDGRKLNPGGVVDGSPQSVVVTDRVVFSGVESENPVVGAVEDGYCDYLRVVHVTGCMVAS